MLHALKKLTYIYLSVFNKRTIILVLNFFFISFNCTAANNLEVLASGGSGFIGLGATFTANVTGPFLNSQSDSSTLIGIGPTSTSCYEDGYLGDMDYSKVISLSSNGRIQLGILPNMTITANWVDNTGVPREMHVTWNSRANPSGSTTFPGYNGQIYQSGPTAVGFRNPWCFRPAPKGVEFIKKNTPVTYTASGNWSVFGSGYQLPGTYSLPSIFIGKLDSRNISTQITSPANTIIIGKISCAFDSQAMTVPFGVVPASSVIAQSLASYDLRANISCSRGSNTTQDIDVFTFFDSNKSTFGGDGRKLSTSNPNLFIIGDLLGKNAISNCSSPRGISFIGDTTSSILLGTINSTTSTLSPVFHFQLCVGGVPVTTGPVTANATVNLFYQ